MALPKKSRLSEKTAIEKIFSKGGTYSTPFFRVRFLPLSEKKITVAVVVSKKQSKKAVERNRMRRKLQESFRLVLQNAVVEKGAQMVVMASSAVLNADFEKIHKEVENFLEKKNFASPKISV